MVSSARDPSNNIKRHQHPRVLPFAETESQNICFAKNKRKNRNRMLLLGLQATINKCNLLICQKRASCAALLTQGCLSWAEDAFLINHSRDEKTLLLLSTSPALPPQVFPHFMSQITVKHRKCFIQGKYALIHPFSPPHKTPWCNSSSFPLPRTQWNPASIFSTGTLDTWGSERYLHMQFHTTSEPFSAFWNTQSYLQNP